MVVCGLLFLLTLMAASSCKQEISPRLKEIDRSINKDYKIGEQALDSMELLGLLKAKPNHMYSKLLRLKIADKGYHPIKNKKKEIFFQKRNYHHICIRQAWPLFRALPTLSVPYACHFKDLKQQPRVESRVFSIFFYSSSDVYLGLLLVAVIQKGRSSSSSLSLGIFCPEPS